MSDAVVLGLPPCRPPSGHGHRGGDVGYQDPRRAVEGFPGSVLGRFALVGALGAPRAPTPSEIVPWSSHRGICGTTAVPHDC
jgi:hypothetical protein